ncbi:hypothetical protein PF005_g33194, partial [Phytophthora fragariae]
MERATCAQERTAASP